MDELSDEEHWVIGNQIGGGAAARLHRVPMSDWIKKAADQERQRRKSVEEFAAAAQSFLREFAQKVEEDINAFSEEFPDEQVSTEFPNPLEFRIQRFTGSRNTPYLARLVVLPERSVLLLVIVHENEEFKSAEIPAQVVDGQLMIPARSPGPQEIRVQLLFPILFPELSADSNALSACKANLARGRSITPNRSSLLRLTALGRLRISRGW